MNAGISYAAIRDGSSNTIMLGKDAGRPLWYGTGASLISQAGQPQQGRRLSDPNANFSIDGSNFNCTPAFVGSSLVDTCVPGHAEQLPVQLHQRQRILRLPRWRLQCRHGGRLSSLYSADHEPLRPCRFGHEGRRRND